MSKKETKYCETCGQKDMEYPHYISKGTVRAFGKAALAAHPGRKFAISRCGLTYSQRENIRKLQYWGLIVKVDCHKQKGGDWSITDKGMAFLMGQTALDHKVWTYRGVVQRFEGKMVSVTSATGGWKYRPDYAREAMPHFRDDPEQGDLI